MLRGLVSLIAPPLCGVCGEACRPSDPVCARCANEINGRPPLVLAIPGVDEGWAATPYEGAPRRLVAGLKFGRRLALAAVAAGAVVRAIPDGVLDAGTLVPVPADPWRLRIRGFDPAAMIAADLAPLLDLPLSNCLARPHRRRQVGQAQAQRLTSELGVQTITAAPSRPILIDDVVTTGATLAACAGALRQAGSGRVLALAFARA